MNDETQQQSGKRNNRPFWALLALFGIPYIAAWVFYTSDDMLGMSKTSNYGELVSPVQPIGELTLQRIDGSHLSTKELQGKWLLISVGDSGCEQPCQDNFYKMRQIRKAMAKDRSRVNRMFVMTDNSQQISLQEKLKGYERMEVIEGSGPEAGKLLTVLGIPGKDIKDRVFVIDPIGNLMMRYPLDAEPEGMLKDLKRLLKVSKVG